MLRRTLLNAVGAGALMSPLPLRYALAAPSPPYNFSTLAASSQVKLLGVNLIDPPTFVGLASNAWTDILLDFTSGHNTWVNWIRPQIRDAKRRGANHVHQLLCGEAVLRSVMTQNTLNTIVGTICAEVKAQGMTVSFCSLSSVQMADLGFPSAATVWAVMKSILDNVIVPSYLDVVAYVEPGLQESRNRSGEGGGNDLIVNDAVLGLMRAAGYATPIGVSATTHNTIPNLYPDFSVYTSASYDVALPHIYPEQLSLTNSYPNIRNEIWYKIIKTANKPYLIQETGWGITPSFTDQSRADWLENLLYATWGHPNCVGVLYWGGRGDSSESYNGRLWTTPTPYNANGYDPTKSWEDTVAARVFAAWGTPNRKTVVPLTLNASQAITTTPTEIGIDSVTPIQGSALASINLGSKVWASTPCSLVGTATVTGDAGTTYTVDLYALDFVNAGNSLLIGSASRVGPGTVTLNISGSLPPGEIDPIIRVSRGAGVNGNITALSATYTEGTAPALNSPKATPLVL